MKEKIELQYIFERGTSRDDLWECISTPYGLAGWFADEVSLDGNVFTFVWGDEEDKAQIKQSRRGVYVRMHWQSETDSRSYFEMRISTDELTQDLVLSVIEVLDSAQREEELDFWDQQVDNLRDKMGMAS